MKIFKRRLVYICDWLPPDFGAVGQYSLHFAQERVSSGTDVALYGLSSTGDSTIIEQHSLATLKIVRVKASLYDRSNVVRRAWWTLITNLRILRLAFIDIVRSEEILFTGSPPFLLHFIAPLNILLRKKLTYRITDFHPECLMAEYTRVPLPLRLLYRITLFWRRRIDLFEVLGEDQRARLIEIGIRSTNIVLRRDPSPVEITHTTRPIARPKIFDGFKILLYSGNFGLAHDYETFHAGYRRHHRVGTGKVVLWLNATGKHADRLESLLSAEQLPVFRSRPVPLDQLASLLVTADAHLITLREPFVGFVLPSKVYGCIASGKDILFIGPGSSDVHSLCSQKSTSGRYFHVDLRRPDAVFNALECIGASSSMRAGAS